ncbi:MAG TPA: biotin/lipoyl-binding protein, partial [Steroidobacteraceae bacterium]|nr:biotin/lipoyl-binding protein [Steroidobacteraceae bacterium]
MNRRVLGVAVALALVLAMVGWYLWRARGADDPNAAISLSGNVDVHQVELAFRVTGRISQMNVQEGDKVTADQPLGQLD